VVAVVITRSELFRFSLRKYQFFDAQIRTESAIGRESISAFRHIKLYFYKFLLWISGRSTRIIFLTGRYRLLFTCWLGFLLPATIISIFFRAFWLSYWLTRLTLNVCFRKPPLQVNKNYDFLIPHCFSSASYSLQNPDDVVYTVTGRSGLAVHFLEIFTWLVLKVPYYRSFDLIFKLINFRSSSFGRQNSFLTKATWALMLILFKLVFHIPLYVVNLSLECTVSFSNSYSADYKNYSRYELLQRYLFEQILFKLFILKELGPVLDKKLGLNSRSIKS
jgi:hypothetical protein